MHGRYYVVVDDLRGQLVVMLLIEIYRVAFLHLANTLEEEMNPHDNKAFLFRESLALEKVVEESYFEVDFFFYTGKKMMMVEVEFPLAAKGDDFLVVKVEEGWTNWNCPPACMAVGTSLHLHHFVSVRNGEVQVSCWVSNDQRLRMVKREYYDSQQ